MRQNTRTHGKTSDGKTLSFEAVYNNPRLIYPRARRSDDEDYDHYICEFRWAERISFKKWCKAAYRDFDAWLRKAVELLDEDCNYETRASIECEWYDGGIGAYFRNEDRKFYRSIVDSLIESQKK